MLCVRKWEIEGLVSFACICIKKNWKSTHNSNKSDMYERWGCGGWERDLKTCQYTPYYILKYVKTLLIQRIKFTLQNKKEK